MMEAAIKWGLTPFAFLALPDMERAMMIAHFKEARLRKAHLDHVQNAVSERHAKKAPGKSVDGGYDQFFGTG